MRHYTERMKHTVQYIYLGTLCRANISDTERYRVHVLAYLHYLALGTRYRLLATRYLSKEFASFQKRILRGRLQYRLLTTPHSVDGLIADNQS
jgi:hypothetical protein